MDRIEYTSCMKPYMTGKGFSKEERKKKMCIGAKICSGKAETEAEAKKICDEQPPKEPKSTKKSRNSCNLDPKELASCLTKRLLPLENIENFEEELTNAAIECCARQKEKKDETAEEAKGKIAIAGDLGLL